MANSTRNAMGIGRGKSKTRAVVEQLAHEKPGTTSAQKSDPVSEGEGIIYDPGAGGDTLNNSRLSAEADEFIPRNYVSYSPKAPRGEPSAPPTDQEGDASAVEEAASRLLDVVSSITLEPGTYKSAVQPFLDSFGSALADTHTLATLLNIIIEQSIVYPNFRYNGARLCSDLHKYVADCKPDFRKMLLERCQEEVVVVLKYADSEPARLQGFVCFLGELYLQLELKPGTGQRINILRDVLYELLQLLVATPTLQNIKCTCMTLKLAGHVLDNDNPAAMDSLVQCLHTVAGSPDTEARVMDMVRNIEQLRRVAWGMDGLAEPARSAMESSEPAAVQEMEPVFYGPDGIVLTHEETAFLQENLAPELACYEELWFNGVCPEYECEGEMNEEEEAAFEEFLKMSEKKGKL